MQIFFMISLTKHLGAKLAGRLHLYYKYACIWKKYVCFVRTYGLMLTAHVAPAPGLRPSRGRRPGFGMGTGAFGMA